MRNDHDLHKLKKKKRERREIIIEREKLVKDKMRQRER